MGYSRAQIYAKLQDLITDKELDRAKCTIYTGMPVKIVNYRMKIEHAPSPVVETKVDTWYKNIILFDNGLSCTMVEMAKYLRNPKIPIGKV